MVTSSSLRSRPRRWAHAASASASSPSTIAKEDLFPNTNVTVTVTVEQHPHVLAIPRAALHADTTGKYVFCVVGGRLRRTPVDAGIVTLDRAEVTHGLAFDQAVVLNAVDDRELRDDMQVRIANGH